MKEKFITIKLKPKEYQLIKFIREEFKFGKIELLIHAGEPQKITKREKEIILREEFGKRY